MASLDDSIRQRLQVLDQQHLRRSITEFASTHGPSSTIAPDNRPSLNFSSNDYLGLSRHPQVCLCAREAVEAWGAGSGASRLICGSLSIHQDLERDLARFKGCEAALLFSSGTMAALGTIPALVGAGDFVVLDRLCHACLVDAARASGAQLRVFRHNDVQDLGRLLDWARRQSDERPSGVSSVGTGQGHILVITESVFSMDGDLAPLREIVECAGQRGAWVMVDEAHATGVLGPGGRGHVEAEGVQDHVDVTLGTLGKALGSSGGFIGGSHLLREYLISRARTFIFSTAPDPAASGAARAALRVVGSQEGTALRAQLNAHLSHLHEGLTALGWHLPPPRSPIIPLVVGDEAACIRLAAALREDGLFIPAIRHPTVGRGRARLRITLSALHSTQEIHQLLDGLGAAVRRVGGLPRHGL